MVIVVTSESTVKDEASLINHLFDEGLEILHLRKPASTLEECKKLLDGIRSDNYNKIALHQHHDIAEQYEIKRLHFKEADRLNLVQSEELVYKQKIMILSTSLHHSNEIAELPAAYDYVFLGPVYSSISKSGYNSDWGENTFTRSLGTSKIIAIGGIDEDKIDQVKARRFDGIAALGAIWNDPVHCVKKFKALQRLWR